SCEKNDLIFWRMDNWMFCLLCGLIVLFVLFVVNNCSHKRRFAMAVPGNTWQFVEGWASDIGAGGTGANLVVYHVGHDQNIYHWNGSFGWIPINCRGKAIAVGPYGDLWFTGLEKGVFRRDRLTGSIKE